MWWVPGTGWWGAGYRVVVCGYLVQGGGTGYRVGTGPSLGLVLVLAWLGTGLGWVWYWPGLGTGLAWVWYWPSLVLWCPYWTYDS